MNTFNRYFATYTCGGQYQIGGEAFRDKTEEDFDTYATRKTAEYEKFGYHIIAGSPTEGRIKFAKLDEGGDRYELTLYR